MVHRETRPRPTPTAAQRQAGFIAFARPWMSFVFPTARPDTETDGLRLFSAQGQTEPTALSIYALRDLPGVRVTMGALRGPDGAVLPAEAWSIQQIEHLSKRLAYSGDRYVVDMPTWLAPHAAPVGVAADRTRTFQLSLATPATAVPGLYRGQVTVTAGDERREVPLTVRILPFRLPELPGYLYGEYYRLMGRYTDTAAKVRADLADMRAHGMTSIGLCIGVDPRSYTVEGDQVRFHFSGDTPFEWVLTAYREFGFPSPLVLLSDSGQDACAAAGLKVTEPRFERLYVNFHLAFAQALKERGWPDIYIQPVDEAGWQSREVQLHNIRLLRLLHQAGVKTEVDGPPDRFLHEEAGPFAAIWCCNGRIGPQEVVDRARAAGKLVLTYNNDTEGFTPEADRWAYGLFNWRNHLNGGYNWEYRGVGGDPYDDLDTKVADFLHAYPAEGGRPGGPSRGWEGSRAGVDDRRYLVLLETLIARGRQAGGRAGELSGQAAAVLADLRGRLDDHRESYRHRSQWGGEYTAEQARRVGLDVADDAAKLVVTGDRKMPTHLTHAEYDHIRWLASYYIMAIREALGEGVAVASPTYRPTRPAERVTVLRRSQSAAAAMAPRPMVRLPKLTQAPTLDGVIDGDPGWAGAATVALTRSDGAGRPDMGTTVRCGLHGDRLWVAFECAEAKDGRLLAQVKTPDGPVWEDDCVEVFLDPGLTGKAYYQVLVNSLGTVARLRQPAGAWRADIQARAKVELDRGRWLVELSIPVGDLKLSPRCGLNFGRERRPFEAFELSTWSVTGGPFGRPERFGFGVVDGDGPAPVIQPKLAVTLAPAFTLCDDAATEVLVDLAVDPAVVDRSRLELRLEGRPRTAPARVPGPLAERMALCLALPDLPPGEYVLVATLTVPGVQPVTQRWPLTRLPTLFAGP